MKTKIYFGPPGTGKTTKLLDIFWELVESGIPSREICFITFTRKAANEARERAIKRFSLEPEELCWFRTLHSLAFQQLGLNRASVMQIGDYLKLCEMLGLSITTKFVSEDGTFIGQTKGDKLFFAEMMARSRMQDLKTYWETVPNEDIYFYELLRLRETLESYKVGKDKMDFTDIITRFGRGEGRLPVLRAAIVDESQDLSPLQWSMVHRICSQTESVHIAGDDDQAIFRWAGADPDKLIGLEGDREVLHQSFRVPKTVQSLAQQVCDRIVKRVPKTWMARDAEGNVRHINELRHQDMSQGTWLLLARNAYLLEYYTQHCLSEGLIFTAPNSPISGQVFAAMGFWEKLRTGEPISAAAAQIVYAYLASGTGVTRGFKQKMDSLPENETFTMTQLRENYGLRRHEKESWDVALDRIEDKQRQYFLAALRRGESLSDEPRIKISTIHGAKGGEADNVVLQVDMAGRTYREYQENPDDEHRVWYVGITRTRETLHIISPRTNTYYKI